MEGWREEREGGREEKGGGIERVKDVSLFLCT